LLRGGPGAVEPIAGDRVLEPSQMDADLVRASRVDADPEEGEVRVAGRNVELGEGAAATAGSTGHSGTTDGVALNGPLDSAGALPDNALNQGEVFLFDFPGRELCGKSPMGGFGAGDEDDSAGFLVEAVYDAGTFSGRSPSEFGEPRQQRVDEGAGVVPGAGVDDHARRFVDSDDGGVLVEHVEGKILGEGVEGRGRRRFNFDPFASAHRSGWFGRAAIDADPAGPDPLLKAGAGVLRKAFLQDVVETLARIGGCDIYMQDHPSIFYSWEK